MAATNAGGPSCDSLNIGEFYFFYVNAWPTPPPEETLAPATVVPGGPVEKSQRHGDVGIFGFQDIPAGLDLYLTDRAWSSQLGGFVPNNIEKEGILGFTTPKVIGVPAGVPFGMGKDTTVYKHGNEWIDINVKGDVDDPESNTTSYFDLGQDGDQVFLYCIGSNGKDRPIAGISYNGPFGDYETYGTNTSSAPAYFDVFDDDYALGLNATNTHSTLLVMPVPDVNLSADSIHVNNRVFQNWQYNGPMDATMPDVLKLAIRDTGSAWRGINPDGTSSSSPPLPWTTSSSSSMANTAGLFAVLWYLLV